MAKSAAKGILERLVVGCRFPPQLVLSLRVRLVHAGPARCVPRAPLDLPDDLPSRCAKAGAWLALQGVCDEAAVAEGKGRASARTVEGGRCVSFSARGDACDFKRPSVVEVARHGAPDDGGTAHLPGFIGDAERELVSDDGRMVAVVPADELVGLGEGERNDHEARPLPQDIEQATPPPRVEHS